MLEMVSLLIARKMDVIGFKIKMKNAIKILKSTFFDTHNIKREKIESDFVDRLAIICLISEIHDFCCIAIAQRLNLLFSSTEIQNFKISGLSIYYSKSALLRNLHF